VVLISESRGDSNQCTPCMENPDQHATLFPHSVHVWPLTIRISRGSLIATFYKAVNNDGQSHCSREKGFPIQSIARRLTDPWARTQLMRTSLCWIQPFLLLSCMDQLRDHEHNNYVISKHSYARLVMILKIDCYLMI
jgi:hypothetical protein